MEEFGMGDGKERKGRERIVLPRLISALFDLSCLPRFRLGKWEIGIAFRNLDVACWWVVYVIVCVCVCMCCAVLYCSG
jgi:hypothetical protein